ncbi:hypothetical protein CIPAW_05G044900, partial [Carya illinoinensis]
HEFWVDLENGFLLYGPQGYGKPLIAKVVANEVGANFIHIKVDVLTTKRGKERGWVVERLLNQLLIELDGATAPNSLPVVISPGRPEVMDHAVLRPSRFGKLLYVPLPSSNERGLILRALGWKKPIDANVDLSVIGRMEVCENLRGANLAALVCRCSKLTSKLSSKFHLCDKIIIIFFCYLRVELKLLK